MNDHNERKGSLSRRGFLGRVGLAAAAAAAAPYVWIPGRARAQTSAHGAVKHLIYIRLSGGFRFPPAFNADVSDEFNPFGLSDKRPAGVQWGVGKLLERAGWLEGDGGAPLREAGLKPLHELAGDIAVLPCVDHEPLAGSADGNHGTGLERYLTGYVGGATGFFTMINYGVRERVAAAAAEGVTLLPAFVLGEAGMGRGAGEFAAYRPPVVRDSGFDRFGFNSDDNLPAWARKLSQTGDARLRDRQHLAHRATIDAFMQTREVTKSYSQIFQSDVLKIGNNSDELVDGISNRELRTLFGDNGSARNLRLALRLFHFGCPAVYLDQGGYDMHSGEENGLPGRIEELNRLVSALHFALHKMQHPAGGSYWDHTMVVLGSEFSRTTRGNPFNSARGSDHGGDYATRWMSMPFMGGAVTQGGRQLGATRPADLKATGKVYSYRSVLKTLMDALGADHLPFFPADEPFDDLFA